jgi:hypothetical protein
MSYDRYRISIEQLENGWTVELPDFAEIAAKKKAAAKSKDSSNSVAPYLGDCTKSFAAKNVAEVLKLVKGSLENMPESEYDKAFGEAPDTAT